MDRQILVMSLSVLTASVRTLNMILILAFWECVQSLDIKYIVKALSPERHSECIIFQANFSLNDILEECQ